MNSAPPTRLAALDDRLAAVPGTVSVYCGPLSGPAAYLRAADERHYAASTMKAVVLAAAHRMADAGRLDLDAPVRVHDSFASAADGSRFTLRQSYDNDDEVWARQGEQVPLRWLLRRMIVRSSNLATNLVIERSGTDEFARVWADAGALDSVVARGIEDQAAERSGISNQVTAADLARLLSAIATRRIASPPACEQMMEVLLAQEGGEDLAAGLPPGTRIAHKNGWVHRIRHGAGVVLPDDAAPYVVAVCTTTDLRDQLACRLVADISAAAWADRHQM